jgi:UDP-4-amino-4,6-dideoxy-N-acetyl-beta-L-altrosamine N-acetyltransferase
MELHKNITIGKLKFKNFINLNLEENTEVLSWRNDDRIKNMMFTKDIISLSSHLNFIDALKSSSTKLYYIVEYADTKIGVVDYYDIEVDSAYWGFYLNPNLLNSSFGVLLEYYVLELAFGLLKIDTLYCETLKKNERVLKMHTEFGFIVDKQIDDSIHTRISKVDWEKKRVDFEPLMRMF